MSDWSNHDPLAFVERFTNTVDDDLDRAYQRLAQNFQKIEDWAEHLFSIAHTHLEAEVTNRTVSTFLGRTLVQAAAWSNAPADSWEDWGGASPLSVAVTKAQAGTDLLVEYGFSVFRTTAGGAMNYAIHESVGAARHDQITGFVNGVAEHEGFTGSALIPALATGAHTLKLQIDNTTAGGNVETATDDYGWINVWEVT